MNYIILQGDGMADYPLERLKGQTPLSFARKKNIDWLAKRSVVGMVRTIPHGMHPGSDIGNMSIFGYDPVKYYTGRAPIEAAGQGINLERDDVACRCNLVTLDRTTGGTVMKDYSAGHITTEEAAELIRALSSSLRLDGFRLHLGVSYRHLMVWQHGPDRIQTFPPHDITDQDIATHMPEGDGADRLVSLIRSSWDVLESHPVNVKRKALGKSPANSIWIWGLGKAMHIPPFKQMYNLSGACISAVDLVRGIARLAGFDIIDVPGITGWVDTNYSGKAAEGVNALRTHDLIYIHVEAPDEAGHIGDIELKVKAIEDFDEKVVGGVLSGLGRSAAFRMLVMPDHRTPIARKTHTEEPVPFLLYDSEHEIKNAYSYDELSAGKSGVFIENGFEIMPRLLLGRGRHKQFILHTGS
ncbi:MAG: cofactor-independent phosphoglycerate mutase [Deltaproteobacteria bacterium]|nr:cofactor-independent phosphoglycerate mutase [Deltaproteobacteria bacterium]MCL5276574.1 cofactor-independent phosphoglycerate mutase [Deltaproteobacteria bacterium]